MLDLSSLRHFLSDGLTRDPLSTLIYVCIASVFLQGFWAEWLRKGATSYESKGSERRSAWLATFAASIAFYIVLIFFGAPISSHHLQSYLLSFLLALFTVLPAAYTLGLPTPCSDTPSLIRRTTWVRLFVELSPKDPVERALVYPAIGAALGCWVGAIPIPLDWNRPWQAWPLPPMFGAILGYVAGSCAAFTISRAEHAGTKTKTN